MFETQERVEKWADEVHELTVDLQRGDVLTHDAIGGVLQCEPHEGSWDHVVNKVRRRLERERGIATWPDITIGYRLLTKDEQLALPAKRFRKAVRQSERARRSVLALPTKGLNMHQARLRQRQIERCMEQTRALRASLREQNTELRPTATLPRNRG